MTDLIARIDRTIMDMAFLEEVPGRDRLLNLDLGIDSLRLVELVARLEGELAAELDLSDLDPAGLNTVEDIYRLFDDERD